MSIKASIHHLTHYTYDRPVTLGPQVIRLRPAPHSRTRVISHSLKVSPANHFVNYQQDPYGNWLARYVFPEPVREFQIEVDLVADMTVYNPFDFFVEEAAEFWPFDYPDDIRPDLEIYRRAEPVGPHLQAFLATVPRTRERTVDFIVGLNARVSREIGYVIRMEPGVQTPEETFERGNGLMPRFELAARSGAAESGPGGPLCLGLPHPAQAGSRLARWPCRHGP